MTTKFKSGDILVCIDGFCRDRGKKNYGGAGYEPGMIKQVGTHKHDPKIPSDTDPWFGFFNDNGVFPYALRLATEQEAAWWACFRTQDAYNIKDMPEPKEYKIKYMSTDGTERTRRIIETSEDKALESIEDLQSLVYIIG